MILKTISMNDDFMDDDSFEDSLEGSEMDEPFAGDSELR